VETACICDALSTPFGTNGSIASVRADDIAAVPIRALPARNSALDPAMIDRNVARMALLLAGIPQEVPGKTINPRMRERYGVDSMAETAENVAAECGVSRSDQDDFALRSQQRCAAASASQLKLVVRADGTVTAGNASLRKLGVADDAAHVNPNGGAVAPGHPLGANGARRITTALHHLLKTGRRHGLCTTCIGVGQR
jgi:acetyl-CoA acetyltransferase